MPAEPADPPITPIILSGGAGSRLWPLSRRHHPKQLMPLLGEQTMLQLTARRVAGRRFAPIWVACGDNHRAVVLDQLGGAGVDVGAVIIEPVARNTAPAVAAAAIEMIRRGGDSLALVLPSDHLVGDVAAFLAAVDQAAAAAARRKLVTFGLPPTAPETGYGYIGRGAVLQGMSGVFAVARFREKPTLVEAEALLADGGYYWNSGMFLFRPDVYLEELERYAPAVYAACRNATQQARRDGDLVRLDQARFADAASISIDHAVMEHTARAAVVPADIGWNDIGAWSALWEVGGRDASGNVVRGDVVSAATHDSYLHSDGPLLAAIGMRDIVVVASDDAVLVVHKDAVQGVKDIALRLAAEGRQEALRHRRESHSWGRVQVLADEPDFRVRRIDIDAARSAKFAAHADTSRQWIATRGSVRVDIDGRRQELATGAAIQLPSGAAYTAQPAGAVDASVLEVSFGVRREIERE